jgi:hypothetical protein
VQDPDRVYKAGDVLRGMVHVDVSSECQCNALTLDVGWETRGRGNRASETLQSQVLFTGGFQPGQNQTFPFELTVPGGPPSYVGHYLSIVWQLRARADIPWALDPKASQDIMCTGSDTHTSTQLPQANVFTLPKAPAFMVVFLLLFSIIPLWVTYQFVQSGGTFGLLGMGIGLLVIGFVAVRIYRLVRNRLARMKLGDVQVTVSHPRPRLGEMVKGQLAMTPAQTTSLTGIQASLVGSEVVVSGSGTNRRTHTHVFHEEAQDLGNLGGTLNAHHPLHSDIELRLPAQGPCSFHTTDNTIKWVLKVHIDIPRWPDFVHEEPLEVRP